MKKDEKLKIIKDAEILGYEKFNVDKKSSIEDIDKVIGFLRNSIIDLHEHVLDSIKQLDED